MMRQKAIMNFLKKIVVTQVGSKLVTDSLFEQLHHKSNVLCDLLMMAQETA